MTRAAGYGAALAVAAALATGCSTAVPGAATPNPAVKEAHVACVRATNDAVAAVKVFFVGVEAFAVQPLDAQPLRAMRAACNDEFVPAYSDFLVRIRREYSPSTVMGKIGQNQFMTQLCRNDTVVGVKVDELTEDAQKACRGT